MQIAGTIEAQKKFFVSGKTLDIDFRMKMLRTLDTALDKWETPLYEALFKDLHKSREEAYMTEFSMVRSEIRTHLGNLRSWTRNRKVFPSPAVMPSSVKVVCEPLGTALIMAPWNYPVQLLLCPLVGAISAGCTAVLKTSPLVPEISSIMAQMISETFSPEYIAIFSGHREVNTELLEHKFDIIFFTGSPSLGRTVMQAAARHLTPVVLELGGKSPCIVDEGADIAVAARKIAWGKSLNAGQTCIAPDYLMVHSSLKEAFIENFAAALRQLYGNDIKSSPHYARMVSEKAFDRVRSYIEASGTILGGHCDRSSLFIEPTLVIPHGTDSPVMTEEIFGPVLPLLEFESLQNVREFISERPSPLALYYFGDGRRGNDFVTNIRCGGACVNDTIMHIAAGRVPFGGIGESGMGCYHGKDSFLAFSHRKTVLKAPKRRDAPFRYPPYRLFRLVRLLLG